MKKEEEVKEEEEIKGASAESNVGGKLPSPDEEAAKQALAGLM